MKKTHAVDIPDFTKVSNPGGSEFRELGISLASQLPEEVLTTLLPDQWAAANPKQVLVHRVEEARRIANRKRDDRQKRREKSAAADLPPPRPRCQLNATRQMASPDAYIPDATGKSDGARGAAHVNWDANGRD